MNFFNRAVKNITRKLSKTILLMLTFFVIGNFVIIGLSVSNAAESAKVLTRQKMRAVVTVSSDYEKMYEDTEDMESTEQMNFYKENGVKISDIDTLLLDDRVKTANATSFSQGYLPTNSSITYSHLNNTAEDNMTDSTYVQSLIGFKSNYYPNMIEIEDGKYTITSGRFYNTDEITNGSLVCLVTEELAEENSLRVGDRIDVCFASPTVPTYMDGLSYDESEVTMDLEIIGIYSHTDHITVDAENFDYTYPYENPDNLILIPGNTISNASVDYEKKIYEYYYNLYPDEAMYSSFETYLSYSSSMLNDITLLLNDPLEVDQFVEDYDGKLGEYIKMDANNDEFNRLSRPLDTLSLYSNFIVWLVVINAVVIITLVTALTLKTREFEIGVLLSIGASKAKVIAQFFLELALIAIISFTIAIGTGTLVSKKVGSTVLEYQINASGVNEDSDDDSWYDYGDSVWSTDYTTEISMDDLVSEYDASVSPVIIGEIYVLGLGIVLVSVLIPSAMIMRYNPKMILMGMN